MTRLTSRALPLSTRHPTPMLTCRAGSRLSRCSISSEVTVSTLKFLSILLLLGLNSTVSRPALAATTNVSFGSYYFDPSVVQINVGDTVIWTNGIGSHTVQGTGSDPMCGGAYLPCSHTFNTPGTYPYECILPYH